jgi:hypothetical protein
MIPVFNFVKPNIYDDIAWQGCKLAKDSRESRYYNESTYADYSPYVL